MFTILNLSRKREHKVKLQLDIIGSITTTITQIINSCCT